MPSPSELRWCVGKFIYPRGGSTLLHYMPLHDFHLEDALTISAIVSLRTQRIEGGSAGIAGGELSRWMDITAAETIASVATTLLDGAPVQLTVVEYDPGIGLVFEALKLALSQKTPRRSVCYTGIGPERRRFRFEMLHGQDYPAPTFASASHAPADLVIVNHANGIREQEGPVVSPNVLIPQLRDRALIALRVAQGSVAQVRTTVTGRDVELPAFEAVLALCRATGAWRYRYYPDHDAGFFLPEQKPETGLLIAFRGGAGTPRVPRFRSIDDET